MPLNAIAVDNPDEVLPLARIPAAIARLVTAPAAAPTGTAERIERETDFATLEDTVADDPQFGVVSAFACPSCGGSLWESPEDELRFRCRIGHAFGSDGLLLEKSEQLDRALSESLRALEERGELSTRVARRLRQRGLERRAARYEQVAEESERHAVVIRNVLLHRNVDGGSREN
jgi:two-component system chemotaxis response regulator CheB